MNISNRRRGILNYLRKKIARKYLKKISREHIKTRDQLVMFSFDYIAQSISIDGRFESNELSLIEKMFKDKLGEKLTLDIGANIGNHTVALSKFSKAVYSFEPNPIVFDVLRINTKNLDNVEIFNFGASNADQSIIAKIPKSNCGGGTVSNEESAKTNQFYELSFNLKALDQLDILKQQDVGLIKIDVEGHELQAFEGMASLLKQHKPVIVFEQNRGVRHGTSPEIDFLKSLGYKHLYELQKIEKWITPQSLPKILTSFFNFIEVLILGEPSGELELNPIETLNQKSYDMLVISFDSLS